MKDRLNTALLVVVAALLAVNALKAGPAEVQADAVETGVGVPPQLIAASYSDNYNVMYRFYDDGSVEWMKLTTESDPGGCSTVPAGICTNGSLIDFCYADTNYDHAVDVGDILNVLALWGPCPVPDGQ